jgi:asparagine synthase (glutamine-hydrolysing)
MHPDLHQEYLRKKAQNDANSSSAKSFSFPGAASLYSSLSGFGRIGRRFGIRIRDPWADVRVLKFFLALPLHHKVRHGWTKYPVRRAFRNDVKSQVLWRRDKEHVGQHFTRQLMEVSDNYVRETLNDGLHVIADYVDSDVVRKLMSQYHSARSADSIDLVRDLVTLILWLRR